MNKKEVQVKKAFKILRTLILGILLLLAFYFTLAYLLTFFPKEVPNSASKEKSIYILYSDMHTDIVFKIEDINTQAFPEFNAYKKGYIAFGWGDKDTYLNTPTWDDLKVSTAFKALLLNTPSLMHVSYYSNIHYYKNVKTIMLSKAQQHYLEQRILENFSLPTKRYEGYGNEDYFYTATASYNIIHTCNSWTGDRLREANVSMSYWTPLSQNVTAMLP